MLHRQFNSLVDLVLSIHKKAEPIMGSAFFMDGKLVTEH